MPTLSPGSHSRIDVDLIPDECPVCHWKINAEHRGSYHTLIGDYNIVFQCPNQLCHRIFIGDYINEGRSQLKLKNVLPAYPVERRFEKAETDVSPLFCEIYNQAYQAEQLGLKQICGVGYRKSLEFLVKDYVSVGHDADGTQEIRDTMLGKCIDRFVKDDRIKGIAKRATWLGNDEAHYERRWADKDLQDLKNLIDLMLFWIRAERLTEETITGMQAR